MKLTIKVKLLGLVGFLVLLMLVIGAIGLAGFRASDKALEAVFQDNLYNTTLLSKIDGLMRANRIQMLLALQHDPKNEFSSLHEHPTSAHTDQARGYIAEIDKLWGEYAGKRTDAASRQLVEAFQNDRSRYIKDGLEPAISAVLDDKFHEAYRITFDVINPSIQKANKSLEALVKNESELAQAAQAAARKRYALFRNVMTAVLGAAVLLGFAVGIAISRSIVSASRQLREAAGKLAEGDFTPRLNLAGGDELAAIGASFDGMAGSISQLVGKIAFTTADVTASAAQVHDNAEEMVRGVENVSGQAVTVATAGEEMASTSGEIARNCQMAADSAGLVIGEANRGSEIIQESMRVMARIAERVSATATTVEALGQRSDQIGEIVSTIEEIADQTNLLALNAAIEAARAGEQGRGFAVVADEVRALAERTTRATREISEMIKAIQVETREAVTAMNEGVTEVERGSREAGRSGEAMEHILDQINNLSMQVSQIATAAEEQTATTVEISNSINGITQVADSTSRNAHQTAGEANQLNIQAEKLSSLLAALTIDESIALCLRKARSAHMIFTGKIKAHLDGHLQLDPNALPSHLTCVFGKWYQTKGQQNCGHHAVFREIDAPHAKVHEFGRKAVQAHNAGDRTAAAECCREMMQHSTALLGMLEQLEKQCV